MPKSIDELQAELTKAQADLAEMTDRATKAEGERDAATAAKAEVEKKLAEASDEVIKIDEATEVRKSEVGEGQFKVTKALVEKAELADLTKRAEIEFRHVTGKSEDKAKVLRAIGKIEDEDTRKAAEAILASAEKMAKGAFDMLGGRGPVEIEDQETAKAEFSAKVDEIQKRDDCTRTEAMTKARRENADLFERSQGEASAAAAN